MTSASKTIVFGGGCFWCTEAVFKILKGILAVTPGYTGGTSTNPNYHEVSEGNTRHVEVVEVVYDPGTISLRDLLAVFFATHDGTSLNRQGNDVGTQYRSVIFYNDQEQQKESQDFIAELNANIPEGKNIVTTVEPLRGFYSAEKYHIDYYERNQIEPYCELVISPKLRKVQNDFAELLKKH